MKRFLYFLFIFLALQGIAPAQSAIEQKIEKEAKSISCAKLLIKSEYFIIWCIDGYKWLSMPSGKTVQIKQNSGDKETFATCNCDKDI